MNKVCQYVFLRPVEIESNESSVESFSTISIGISQMSFLFKFVDINQTYKLQQFIGIGAYSIVRHGKHKVTGEKHAIKVIDKNNWSEDQMLEIQREASYLEALVHENIVEYKDFYVDQQNFYIATERMDTDLLFFLNHLYDQLTEQDIKLIFINIANGVNFCHYNNIIHKDLKPENILINYDIKTKAIKAVKLADFGLACKRFTSLYRKQFLGTPGYEAPECLMGDINFTEKVDTYALGIVLYNMVTGKMPFKGNDQQVIVSTLMKNPSYSDKVWKQCSPKLKDLVQSMIQRNPNDRLDLDEVLQHEWLQEDNGVGQLQKLKRAKMRCQEDRNKR